MKKILNFIFKPFEENLPLLLALWILASGADTFFWSLHGNPVFGIYMGVHGLIECYLIVLVCGLFKGKLLKAISGILVVLGIINLAADAFVHDLMHFSFTGDMVAIIMGTNPSEASEFLPMYLNARVITFIAVAVTLALLILAFGKSIRKMMGKWVKYCAMLLLLASIAVVTIRKSNNWEGVFLCKFKLFLSYKPAMDLAPYRTDPEVIVNGEQPDVIVLIIGESLSRRHCSLYGYGKNTNPSLEELQRKSSLLVFDNVKSPYTNTVESFKSLMTTYRTEYNTDNWYEYTYLMDAMKSAGYTNWWISNQSSAGVYDNIVARFAELADSTIWCGAQGMGIGKHDFDEIVIPEVEAVIGNGVRKKFIVAHLMGSHEGFASRYPASFAKWNERDYPDNPVEQRKTLSEYDNSVLYNDHVVSELMHLVDGRNGIAIFFPDHSLDVYDSDPTYIGHARTSNPVSVAAGSEIPFVIHCSEEYLNNFSNIAAELGQKTNSEFCTGDIIYLLMDIANCSLAL